jgi:lysyl-tRNA synthetase class 2
MPDKVDPAVKAATSATASAATSANAPGDTKLLKDDETGEMVSKTELKRRQRARATAAKKSEKKSAAPPEQKKVNEALGDLDPRQV